jgi:hypothetical protein
VWWFEFDTGCSKSLASSLVFDSDYRLYRKVKGEMIATSQSETKKKPDGSFGQEVDTDSYCENLY